MQNPMTLLLIAAVQPADARYLLPESSELVVTADSLVDATVAGFDTGPPGLSSRRPGVNDGLLQLRLKPYSEPWRAHR